MVPPGAVIPLDDESKSSEDIVNELLDRKFSVNVVSAKAVDQKGQAFVRSLIRSDEAGEELYRGLGDNEDEAVDHLVALARDDYPFEHNTWAGGVRADDVKANKGQALPSESSDEEELEETDREYRQPGGGADVVHSGEGRGQPSMREGEARIGGRPTSAGVGDLVRQAAEAFEAQLLPMFEGYMVSMKDHISKELSKLMTEVASANSSIAAVETFVKTELATLRNGTAGVDMYSGDLFSGYSPAMRSPSHGPSSPSRQRNKGTADTRVDAEDSPQIDEVDGNAAIGKKSCPSEMAPGDPKSDPPESLIEEIVTGAMPTSSSGVDAFLDVSETDNPLSDTPPAASSSVVEVPSDVSHTNTKAAPGSTVDAIPTELPVLPSTIHEVQTDVSDTVRGPSAASIVEIVPTQSPTIEPKLHDVEDDVEGSVATEKDEVLTKKTTSKPRKAGRAVKLTTVVPTQVCRRYSKREHRSPDRYTPSEGPEKQEPGKRARRGAKEKQNVVASVAEPSIPIKETTSLIGGFTPFLPPNPVKRATFLEAMKDAKTQSAAKDSAFDVHTLMPLFDSSRVASEKAIDCVVAFIRKRRDAKEAFSFSPSLKKQFTDRPQWFTQVDILHIPVLMNKRQWVGIIVDLNMWAMSVVEANPGCPSEFEFTYLLTAASILFPHLIGRYCMTNHAQKRNFEPMTFSRLDMPCVVEHPGCSAAVALMFLELHAVGKDVTVLKFTEEQVRTAGENYAVDALHLCQGVPIPFTQ
uniref:Ubiquitin-like protease family profile domain-containing protein n=1 Tax=Brassica campestris TaxID=3711 RepID=M4DGK2_BRACM